MLCQPSPVQILVVGDLHYDLRQFDWVLDQATEFDAVVIVGDLLDISSTVPLDAQVPVVLRYLERLAGRGPTLVCSGNHDLTGRDEAGEKAARWMDRLGDLGVVGDGSSVMMGDALFTVCPWWDGPIGRERVERQLIDASASAPPRWIWLYHWPPPDLGVSWTGHKSYGDADLARWIDRFGPALVLTGHVHQAPLIEGGSWIAKADATWVINAGRQIGSTPSHAVVDLDAWTARWWSYEDQAEQDL
jgi:Icc-related predicted phosphoesterase